MHERCHVPFLNVVPLNTMPSKLRVAKPQLIFAHVMHFVAPIAVRRSAAIDAHGVVDATMPYSVGALTARISDIESQKQLFCDFIC